MLLVIVVSLLYLFAAFSHVSRVRRDLKDDRYIDYL